MGSAEGLEIWVAIRGLEVEASTNLKGIADGIGASYATVKKKGLGLEVGDWFTVSMGSGGLSWSVKRVLVRKVGGRGRKGGFG